LSKDFSPRPMASSTIKWLGLSLILTFDISLVICTKQNLNSILRDSKLSGGVWKSRWLSIAYLALALDDVIVLNVINRIYKCFYFLPKSHENCLDFSMTFKQHL
jgi:hypothetical protein